MNSGSRLPSSLLHLGWGLSLDMSWGCVPGQSVVNSEPTCSLVMEWTGAQAQTPQLMVAGLARPWAPRLLWKLRGQRLPGLLVAWLPHFENGDELGLGKWRWAVLQQPGLVLALTVPLDPGCSGSVLPPHRVHPGGLDAPKRSRLFPILSHTQLGTEPLSSSVGQGTQDS